VVVALAGVALLLFGVFAFEGGDGGSSGAAPAPTATPQPTDPASGSSAVTLSPAPGSPATTPQATTAPVPSTRPTGGSGGPPGTGAPRPTAGTLPRAPLTVLNNSTVAGLADRAAAQVQARGWQVAQVGNFAGRLPATTVYYDPGDSAQQAAAQELAEEFPQVARVLPRYAGLPPTPAGIVLVVTRDW